MGIKFAIERFLFIFFADGITAIKNRNSEAYRLLDQSYYIIGHGIWDRVAHIPALLPMVDNIEHCLQDLEDLENNKLANTQLKTHTPIQNAIIALEAEAKENKERIKETLYSISSFDQADDPEAFRKAKDNLERLKKQGEEIGQELSKKHQEYIRLNKSNFVAQTKTQQRKRLLTTIQSDYAVIGKYVYNMMPRPEFFKEYLNENNKLKKQLKKINQSILYNNKLADSFTIHLDR